MIFCLSDKVLQPWLEGKEYIDCSDEAEAVGMAAGYYLATGEKATVAISNDGFMNTLNFLTSWIMPEHIPMHFVISTGRLEPQHEVATRVRGNFVWLLENDKINEHRPANISYEIVCRES